MTRLKQRPTYLIARDEDRRTLVSRNEVCRACCCSACRLCPRGCSLCWWAVVRAATDLAVVGLFVALWGSALLWANMLGFLVAFIVKLQWPCMVRHVCGSPGPWVGNCGTFFRRGRPVRFVANEAAVCRCLALAGLALFLKPGRRAGARGDRHFCAEQVLAFEGACCMTSPTAPRALILCADDYALHPAVDAAAEQLTLAGRLSATSCMTTSPRWAQAAPRLEALRPRLSVGLHFNLTRKPRGCGCGSAPGHGDSPRLHRYVECRYHAPHVGPAA